MNILWKKGQGTVGDVVAALPRRPPIAYNTVQTLLRILEEKGTSRTNRSGDGMSTGHWSSSTWPAAARSATC